MSRFDEAAEAVASAAQTLRHEAAALDRLAHRLRERPDPGPAWSAISAITQIPALCRCDVIASRVADALQFPEPGGPPCS